jgi:hypothetical protein
LRSSRFAKWTLEHPFEAHVVLPGIISLLLTGMYFSGNAYLQNIVAPDLKNVPGFTAREFGALEMMQNFFLVCISFYSVRCFLAAEDLWVKLFSFFLIILSVFTLLEEIDYGTHFIEYFTGHYGSLAPETWERNWHNRIASSGVQNVSYLKFAASVAISTGFVLAPLLLANTRNPTLRLLVPSRWVIATVILMVLLSRLAHGLDDAGYSIIDGKEGILHRNISEFRELNMYCLFLLYTMALHERVIVQQKP